MNAELLTSLGYLRIAAISPVVSVGNPEANVTEILTWCTKAIEAGAEVLVFPELCITGYTCADIFRSADLLSESLNQLQRITQYSRNHSQIILVGLPLLVQDALYNVAAVIQHGSIVTFVPKVQLPHKQEFYEHRWFVSANNLRVTEIVLPQFGVVPISTRWKGAIAGIPDAVLGVEICEDVWGLYPQSTSLAWDGVTVVANLSASNELVGKTAYRKSLIASQSARTYTAYVYASAGASESTTDTVFGGHCIIAECGEVLQESTLMELHGSMIVADVHPQRCVHERLNATSWQHPKTEGIIQHNLNIRPTVKHTLLRNISTTPFVPEGMLELDARSAQILQIQATALAMRLKKSGAQNMVLGLSGGLDSTLALLVCKQTATLLNWPASSIICVTMPGFGTTARTKTNAEQLATALETELKVVSISDAVVQHFKDIGHEGIPDITYENAQARHRTLVLMDIANMNNGLVIGTGDLSEIALGWSTYNADHMSMYNVNCGVPKTLVQHIIRWYTTTQAPYNVEAILRDILDTPISPELLPVQNNEQLQQTEQVLGPYILHDFFLYHWLRLGETVEQTGILAMYAFEGKYTPEEVCTWFEVFLKRFVHNQFKRSCMPDGPKVGTVALSPRADWRMPSDASAQLFVDKVRVLKKSIKAV